MPPAHAEHFPIVVQPVAPCLRTSGPWVSTSGHFIRNRADVNHILNLPNNHPALGGCSVAAAHKAKAGRVRKQGTMATPHRVSREVCERLNVDRGALHLDEVPLDKDAWQWLQPEPPPGNSKGMRDSRESAAPVGMRSLLSLQPARALSAVTGASSALRRLRRQPPQRLRRPKRPPTCSSSPAVTSPAAASCRSRRHGSPLCGPQPLTTAARRSVGIAVGKTDANYICC